VLDDIDPVIVKLWRINIKPEYRDWVVNLSSRRVSFTPPSLAAFLLNNEMRRAIIDCDPFSH